MPASPQITLTATLDDLTGQPNSKAKLRITLVNYSAQLPRITGSAMVAQTVYEAVQTGPSLSIVIWGNDVITPSGSFYCVEIFDSKGVRVQAANYQLTGSGTQDLSNLTPYLPPPPVPAGLTAVVTNPPGGSTQTINGSVVINGNLTVSGTINGNTGGNLVVVGYASAISFDGAQGNAFKCTLAGDTTLSIANMTNKGLVSVMFVQDATGGHAVTWPAIVKNHGEINPGAGVRSTQLFMSDADGSLVAVSTMQYS